MEHGSLPLMPTMLSCIIRAEQYVKAGLFVELFSYTKVNMCNIKQRSIQRLEVENKANWNANRPRKTWKARTGHEPMHLRWLLLQSNQIIMIWLTQMHFAFFGPCVIALRAGFTSMWLWYVLWRIGRLSWKGQEDLGEPELFTANFKEIRFPDFLETNCWQQG